MLPNTELCRPTSWHLLYRNYTLIARSIFSHFIYIPRESIGLFLAILMVFRQKKKEFVQKIRRIPYPPNEIFSTLFVSLADLSIFSALLCPGFGHSSGPKTGQGPSTTISWLSKAQFWGKGRSRFQ
jgi:hypothetical protein